VRKSSIGTSRNGERPGRAGESGVTLFGQDSQKSLAYDWNLTCIRKSKEFLELIKQSIFGLKVWFGSKIGINDEMIVEANPKCNCFISRVGKREFGGFRQL
jgi:hypothetical protein